MLLLLTILIAPGADAFIASPGVAFAAAEALFGAGSYSAAQKMWRHANVKVRKSGKPIQERGHGDPGCALLQRAVLLRSTHADASKGGHNDTNTDKRPPQHLHTQRWTSTEGGESAKSRADRSIDASRHNRHGHGSVLTHHGGDDAAAFDGHRKHEDPRRIPATATAEEGGEEGMLLQGKAEAEDKSMPRIIPSDEHALFSDHWSNSPSVDSSDTFDDANSTAASTTANVTKESKDEATTMGTEEDADGSKGHDQTHTWVQWVWTAAMAVGLTALVGGTFYFAIHYRG